MAPKPPLIFLFATIGLLGCSNEGPSQGAANAPGSPAELATRSGCMKCHAVDKKLVGPAYRDVATRYMGGGEAEAALVARVKAGSMGAWGPIPMPPNAAVKDEDVKILVKWILAGAK